jgi:hypothetical protein
VLIKADLTGDGDGRLEASSAWIADCIALHYYTASEFQLVFAWTEFHRQAKRKSPNNRLTDTVNFRFRYLSLISETTPQREALENRCLW